MSGRVTKYELVDEDAYHYWDTHLIGLGLKDDTDVFDNIFECWIEYCSEHGLMYTRPRTARYHFHNYASTPYYMLAIRHPAKFRRFLAAWRLTK